MPHYMLSVHATGADAADTADTGTRQPEPSAEQMEAWFADVQQLEADMEKAGVWVFSGKLSDPGSATVVQGDGVETILTDGPFAESKEHVAGFYLIEADDLDDALTWAGRVTACIGMPIEVRPFEATGRVQLPASA